ncbi:hypothetical protein [Streptomyces sp. NPDC059008]|uniref:hypothetical protein n=1 Tax=Streptomyces sp. NPDC059008 TaxID=3346693 RepID=UPI0036B1C62A
MGIARSTLYKAGLVSVPVALLAAGVQASAAPSPAPAPAAHKASAFTLSAVRSDALDDLSGVSATSADGKALKAQGFAVLGTDSGRAAVVDRSQSGQGITSAAGAGFVDLSWKGYAPDARYVVSRGDKDIASLGAGVTTFHDTTVKPGATYDYRVTPILPEGGNPDSRAWGMKVTTPTSDSRQALRTAAVNRAKSSAAASMTTVTWMTFIPQKRINSPGAGCDYGSKFQFGGDGHGFNWKSGKYRTSLNAVVTWSSKKVQGFADIGASHVYVKSTGRHVATKTASGRSMKAKKMGSGSNYVDVRMVTHATNPFCKGLAGVKGAIDGALSMHLTKGGNWSIISGKHRLMPNHHIYIYNGGKVTNVYTRKYANAMCLVGSATCPEADLTGYHGKFK